MKLLGNSLEAVGIIAIVIGLCLAWVPLGWIAGGAVLVMAGNALLPSGKNESET